ncbi:MAG TPA: signal peptide peptidase SppA [Verrucomicrobiae bacterium]|nr:signal peptide peptidase SppA [Verrucomicrobiae bacterium]
MEANAPPPAGPPPPPIAPPPVVFPPATQPPRRGRGWMITALVLLVLLVSSVLFNVVSFASNLLGGKSARYGARTAGPRLDEVVMEDNDALNKIAVIHVEGIITGQVIDQGGHSMVELIRAQLKNAQEDDQVKAVILKVDSPGGEVLASDEIYRAISEFESKPSHKPVVASMGSLAASGGYYVSAPCRWIVANDMTITGSIGVIMSSWNYRGLMDKIGLLPQTYKSGKYKDMLSGSREPDSVTPEEKAMLQGLIDETFGKFKSVVQEGRDAAYEKNKDANDKGRPLSDHWQDYADGRVLSGTEAFKLGFVDELGGFKDAVARAKKLAGIGNANLIEYQQRYDISDLFRLFGKSEARVIKVDVGLDTPKLQAGQMYFLSPTFVH